MLPLDPTWLEASQSKVFHWEMFCSLWVWDDFDEFRREWERKYKDGNTLWRFVFCYRVMWYVTKISKNKKETLMNKCHSHCSAVTDSLCFCVLLFPLWFLVLSSCLFVWVWPLLISALPFSAHLLFKSLASPAMFLLSPRPHQIPLCSLFLLLILFSRVSPPPPSA